MRISYWSSDVCSSELLVDDDDRTQAERQRFAGHELGRRQRPFGGIDEQDDAVDHRQDAFDLAAEIGVARRIDDVDPRRVRALTPFDRGAFRQDGDPAFLFDIARIHRAFLDALIVSERPRLAEKLVDECGLAMIDVRDDGDIAPGHSKKKLDGTWRCHAAIWRRA